jgi:hypothetical protein
MADSWADSGAELGPDAPSFEVWRQDDNGNRFLVSAHDDRSSAEDAVLAWEGGVQHKQLYFVVPVDRTR